MNRQEIISTINENLSGVTRTDYWDLGNSNWSIHTFKKICGKVAVYSEKMDTISTDMVLSYCDKCNKSFKHLERIFKKPVPNRIIILPNTIHMKTIECKFG